MFIILCCCFLAAPQGRRPPRGLARNRETIVRVVLSSSLHPRSIGSVPDEEPDEHRGRLNAIGARPALQLTDPSLVRN